MNIIDEIRFLYKQNRNIKLFLDMDGTVVELLIDSSQSYLEKGNYIKKAPILPIIKKVEEILKDFPFIELNILSCSKTNYMKLEKFKWLDKYMPYIRKETITILSEENKDYSKENVNIVKANYIKNILTENDIAILIDDNINVLTNAKKILKEQVLALHVTTLLIN